MRETLVVKEATTLVISKNNFGGGEKMSEGVDLSS